METKELKIQIPEGYCIDESKSTFEKIVFKKKDTKPRSWEEYCKLKKENLEFGYMINDVNNHIDGVFWRNLDVQETSSWRNVLPSEELAEAFLAMMQLMSLRQDWISDWKPDWSNISTKKYVIQCDENKLCVDTWQTMSHPLSFPTREMAQEFLNCFENILEQTKILL